MEDTRFNEEASMCREHTAGLFDKIARLLGQSNFLEMVSAKIRLLG